MSNFSPFLKRVVTNIYEQITIVFGQAVFSSCFKKEYFFLKKNFKNT